MPPEPLQQTMKRACGGREQIVAVLWGVAFAVLCDAITLLGGLYKSLILVSFPAVLCVMGPQVLGYYLGLSATSLPNMFIAPVVFWGGVGYLSGLGRSRVFKVCVFIAGFMICAFLFWLEARKFHPT